MDIYLYNSLTNKIEKFIPIKENELKIYVCGPTVYNDPHIGNMRPVVFFDTLNRFFSYIGYDVKFVSNYTDVDDKIIKKASEEGVTEKVISERYIARYRECLDKLNVLKAYKNPRVTEYMDKIISYIDGLVSKNNAYVVDDEVFFDVKSVEDYGCLSNTKLDELKAGARIEENEKKKCPFDFLLWKKTDLGIKWDTKWCKGRPGWHTECCVMIDSIFNGMIDIHGGGSDLKFPHHENEIAQSMAMHHNHIANYWVHNAMMNINGDKMSKSLGNVILAKDAIELYGADTLRLFLINAPYRSIINLTDKAIQDTKSILSKIDNCYKQLNLILNMNDKYHYVKSKNMDKFLEYMANDMNISNGITYLLDIIKSANQSLRVKELDFELLNEYFSTITDICSILGLHFEPKMFSNEEKVLYNKYIEAKSLKDFATSDILRKQLIDLNII